MLRVNRLLIIAVCSVGITRLFEEVSVGSISGFLPCWPRFLIRAVVAIFGVEAETTGVRAETTGTGTETTGAGTILG